MLPLPTNARTFFTAYFRSLNVTDEETLQSLVDSAINDKQLAQVECLITQGAAAGIAQVEGDDITILFGDCRILREVCDIARDVYNFDFADSAYIVKCKTDPC